MEEHSTEGKPWVVIHQEYGDIEGHILGNARGLQELKDRIDEALQTGVGLSRHLDCDFNSVILLDAHPRDTKRPKKHGLLAQVLCFLISAVLLTGIVAAVVFWLN